ncbi:MAG: heavy-metal-associated domain-containing protein [Tropicimonas sp.]|uniref:heavy-metal-associated domain-containing protein n=1 Tax=Tropicimonas sp. TaxID=2067044 RepID=UPI003A84AF31
MKFSVPDMSCGHCTSAIEKAVKAADAGANVTCDIPARSVTIESSLGAGTLAEILKQAGYDSRPA